MAGTSERTAMDSQPTGVIAGIRVSNEGTRAERLASRRQQEERVRRDAERLRLGDVVDVFYERDTSGHLPLERRHGFVRAIERVERGEVAAIAFAYRDRTDRNIE